MAFTPSIDNVTLTKQVSVVVCEAFHGPKPPGKDLVAHWDGDHLNNRPENLRWATFFENEEDKRRHGRHAAGERNPSVKLTKDQVDAIRRSHGSLSEEAKKYGVSKSLLSMIRNGQVWSDEGNAARRKRRASAFTICHRSPPKRGATSPKAKFTWEIVREIRKRAENGETQSAIARSLGTKQSHIHPIVSGKTWKEARHLNLQCITPCCRRITSEPDAAKSDKTS